MSAFSFTIYGINAKIRVYPPSPWDRNIQWVPMAGGSAPGIDRGAAGDVHIADVTFFGTRDEVETLQAAIDADRGVQTISNLHCQLFDPLIDHTQTITAYISTGTTEQTDFVQGEGGFYEFRASLRAVSYSKVATIASLLSLRLRGKFQAGHTDAVFPRWSYGNIPSPADASNAVGTWSQEFYQNNSESEAILKYFDSVRGKAFAFPTLPGVTYPFGVSMGALPLYCHAPVVQYRRANLHYGLIRVAFTKAYR